MTELDEFLPLIMPKVPGCPEPSAFAAIIRAAQAFCERTRLWRDADQFTVTPTSCNVMCAPEGADVFEIEHARLDSLDLLPASQHFLNGNVGQWRELVGPSKWITQTEPDTVLLVPAGSGRLMLSLILRPSEGATQLPDFIAKHHRQVIADGALADILMLPMQSFTDPSRAQFYSERFEARLDVLSASNIKGQQKAPMRSKAQFM
jgi:hypothetical protein